MAATIEEKAVREFISNDEVLINPNLYPDTYIDGHGDTRESYILESLGATNGTDWNDKPLLTFYLQEVKHLRPLVILDSAGGLGWLEFSQTIDILQGYEFALLLDDCSHVKHFRSMELIKANTDRYTVLGEKDGWALICCKNVAP